MVNKLIVFVSSTMTELRDVREVVSDALNHQRIEAFVYESNLGARPNTIVHTSLRQVEEADVYVGIFWKKYGEVTILEYNHARQLKKPCLIYVRDKDVERDSELESFLKREIYPAHTGVTYKFFVGALELGSAIAKDVMEWLVGRYRELSAHINVAETSFEEIKRLADDIVNLQSTSSVPISTEENIAKLDDVPKYQEYFSHVREQLEILRTDLALVAEGWTLHFAIDFAELFAFAFPSSRASGIIAQPQESHMDAYSRERAALTFLFAKWRQRPLTVDQDLILLPPYLDELRTTLMLLKKERFNAYSWAGILKLLEERAYGESSKRIREILARYSKENKVPENPKDRQVIASYLEKEYVHVVSLLVNSDTRAGLSLLKQTLDSGVISSLEKHFSGDAKWRLGTVFDLKQILNNAAVERGLEAFIPIFANERPNRITANDKNI